MNTFTTPAAGVRLDAWPEMTPQAPQDAPEVAQLREEFRNRLPEVASVLEMLARLRSIQDLAGRLAGPQPAKLVLQKS